MTQAPRLSEAREKEIRDTCSLGDCEFCGFNEELLAELDAVRAQRDAAESERIEWVKRGERAEEVNLALLEACREMKRIAKQMDCTCGSESPYSDMSFEDGGCFQRDIFEELESLKEKGITI